MRKIRIVLLIAGILLMFANLQAQSSNDGSISGSLIAKSSKKPMEFGNVALYKLADSSFVGGTMTDTEGKFYMSHISDGQYYLVCGRLGFEQINSISFIIDPQHPKKDIGKIQLIETALPADSIVVTAEKPTLNIAIDRKVYDTAKDLTSGSGTVADMLQNVPSVSVDIDGNVSLRGSENVLILINGRSSPLMGKNRAAVLQQMPASSIEKVEVITNPSAKYKPEGTSGIINLVLKKNTQVGLNGSLSANTGMDSRFNNNLSLNYNPGHFNLYGNGGIRQDYRLRSSSDIRQMIDPNSRTNSYYNQHSKGHSRPLSCIAGLGMDFTPDTSNRMGISGNYFFRDNSQRSDSRNILMDNNSAVTSDYLRSLSGNEHEFDNEGTAYYERSFGKEDHNLHLEYNISSQPERETGHYANTYYILPQNPPYDNSIAKRTDVQNQFTADYSNPLSENSKFEAGFSHEQNKQDINNYADYFDTTAHSLIVDITKTNRFIYHENIEAIYATFEHSFGKIGFMGGLRYEYAHNNSHLITGDSLYSKNFSEVYPSLHLSYALDENSELQLNYSRRTNRPDGEDLNPFPEYRDRLNIESGNPRLLPEFIHSIELGWQRRLNQLTITPSIYYRYKYNGFTQVTIPYQDSVLLTIRRNLSSDKSAGAELIIGGSVGNYLDADISFNAFRNTIDASNIGFSNSKSVVSWSGNFNINWKPRPSAMLQLNSFYRSARLTPQGRNLANFVANLGMRQDLFNEKISISLTVSDIFNSRIFKTQLRTTWLNGDTRFSRNSRVVFLGAAYHFGKSTKKSEKKTLEFEQ